MAALPIQKERSRMDVRDMTLQECLDNPRFMVLLEKHVPDYKKYPVALFSRMKMGKLAEIAVGQGLVTREKAEHIFDKLNGKLFEEADT